LSGVAITRNVTTAFAGQVEITRLDGQHQETIVKALHDYQHGAPRGRGNVIEDDIKAIAHFISREGADAKP